ncbi:histone deacetylase family protein [Poriferisphaera sp. WC338]|uniref:histone deacetylase family protein n=1 Tax=Poriferisphaera sp. WC338 TaxID=3425129 RepID=UPI003D814C15
MRTGFVYDDRFLIHDTGPGHPERADRLLAIVEKFSQLHLDEQLVRLAFEAAPVERVLRLHDPAYVERVETACRMDKRFIDSDDSAICEQSYEIALLAVGGVLAAVDAVMAGEIHNAFCAVRPPGHHAEHDRSMGFCLFNNIALAADYLTDRYGLERVAIIDFDVHHGNGTQHLLEDRPDILVINLHEHPMSLYPGTGFAYEHGKDAGEGYTLNLPLQEGTCSAEYRQVFLQKAMPKLEAFEPEFILISAGFDASKDDPLAHLELTPSDFDWITRRLKQAAAIFCEGRIVSLLEGGYDLRSLAECAAVHVQALLADPDDDRLMMMKTGF